MTTPSASPVPAIGQLQQLPDRRVFVHRSGTGGPAVVFLPGASAVGLDYFGVQQQVSQFTTAVVYDRCGTGYSDPVPLPRTAASVATELRELLRAQHIAAPFVLAAHSLGGFYAHRFAQLFPSDVAGLVWLDALHRDWDHFMPPSLHLSATERSAPDLAQLQQMRPSLRATYAELRAHYPDHLRDSLIDAKLGTPWLQAGIAERSNLVQLAAELQAGPPIPDVPLIALTALGDPSPGMSAAKRQMDAALVASVSHGEQRLLPDTLHHRLCFDRADAVVQAIRDVAIRVAEGV